MRPHSRMTGFDFTTAMRGVCQDAAARLPELSHVDLTRIAVSFSQARRRVSYGLQASLTPLRFQNGSLTTRRRGRELAVQRVHDAAGREMLYILTFYLPRFLDAPFREKLITVFHELWHISPEFNGDLRRHDGRCYAHTHSQEKYDQQMGVLADRWLAAGPPEEVYSFLRLGFDELRQLHGRVFGARYPRPRLVPASEFAR